MQIDNCFPQILVKEWITNSKMGSIYTSLSLSKP